MDNAGKKLWLFRREQSSGGAEIAASRLTRQFEELDFEVIRVQAGKQFDNCDIKGGSGPGWVRLLQFASTSNRLIKKHPESISFSLERGVEADIYRAGEGVHLAWLKRKGLLKSILSFRPLHPVAIYLERRTLQAAKCIVANSEMIAEEIRSYYPQHAEKVRVIENGFDPARFFVDPTTEQIPKRLLFAGNGWDRKGLDQALSLLSKLPTEWTLDVLGKGDATKYESVARDLQIADRVRFRGSVENIEREFNQSQALVLPTNYDPFSNACLEAAACGCPVITTNSNGFAALIDHQKTGYILNKGSLEHCAEWCRTSLPLDRSLVSQSVANYTIEAETAKYREVLSLL